MRHYLKTIRYAAGLVLLGVAGCGAVPGNSTYGCPGLPEGVVCQDTRSAYAATTNSDRILSPEAADAQADQAPAVSLSAEAVPAGAPAVNPEGFQQGASMIPVRTPAIVMRVWIGPWEDANGDLIWPGFVMTEIEPRRWQIGAPAMAVPGPLYLQDIRSIEPPVPSRPAPAKPASGQPAAASRPAAATTGGGPAETRPPPRAQGASGSTAASPPSVAPTSAGVAISGTSRTFVSPLTGRVRSIEYTYPDRDAARGR